MTPEEREFYLFSDATIKEALLNLMLLAQREPKTVTMSIEEVGKFLAEHRMFAMMLISYGIAAGRDYERSHHTVTVPKATGDVPGFG